MNTKGQSILSNVVLLMIFLVATFVGGIIAGVIYYDMNILRTTLQGVNFQIPIMNNISVNNITDFQGILGATVYPLLGLNSALPYLTYFMIFGFIIALAITAYASSKNAVFFVVHILFTLVIGYFCFILSNVYIQLLQQPFFNAMMVNFTIYNTLMTYLPWVVFFTSLLFGAIAFVSVIKPQSNFGANQQSLNYGGDY